MAVLIYGEVYNKKIPVNGLEGRDRKTWPL